MCSLYDIAVVVYSKNIACRTAVMQYPERGIYGDSVVNKNGDWMFLRIIRLSFL